MNSTSVERPFGVTFIAILMLVVGGLDILGGILALTHRTDDVLLDAVGSTESDLTTYGIALIVIGVLILLTAAALHRGSNFARGLVVTVAVLRLAMLFWALVTYHSVHWYNAFAPALIYILVTGFLLFDEDARRYFEGP